MNQKVLSQLHSTEIEILDEINRIAEANGIKYYLIGGTLLGAVRHKGFIPWDDDLDIAMPRKDFKKFAKCCKKQLKSDYFWQNYSTDKYYFQIFSKMRKRNTIFLQEDLKDSKMNQGIFVDIFPLDDGNNNIAIEEFKLKLSKTISWHLVKRSYKKIPFKHLFFAWIPSKLLSWLKDYVLLGHGNYYVNYGSQYGVIKQTIKKVYFGDPVMLEFEGNFYPVPHDYKYILERLYGPDYMQLPPKEKQVTHDPVRISFDTNGPDAVLEDDAL